MSVRAWAGSDGSVLPYMDLEAFSASGDMTINGLHYVSNNITVGSTNSIDLQRGDILFVSDGDDGTLYIGVPDMSVPGIRVSTDDLAGSDVTDLWTDGIFLYAATRANGIFVYLVDPGCD